MGCWLIDSRLCLSRCCKSCLGVTVTHIKKDCVITRLFCPVVVWGTTYPFPFVHWYIHVSHCAPESCVYFMYCCTCELCFLCRSWEQLPEVLSKLPVWEVRGYLANPAPFNHTGPCSCFLSRLRIWNTHTLGHMFWDFRKAKESTKKATGRAVRFL